VARILCLLIVATSLATCRGEDPSRAAVRARLKQDTRLTPDEIRAFFDQIAPVIAGKKVTVKQGALTRALDDEQRGSVLGMLSDPASVYDGGLKVDGKNVWRGLKTGGTAALSELDATQTLWIDVGSFVPVATSSNTAHLASATTRTTCCLDRELGQTLA
jgi:hypothetical protein